MLKRIKVEKLARRAKMKLTRTSASVLALCFIMLVSTASATYDVQITGGTASKTENGGTAGADGRVVLQPAGINGVHFDNVLSEEIWAKADIASGQTGEASAYYSTNGVNIAKSEHISTDRTLDVSLKGDVSVSLSKSSKEGNANAYSRIYTWAGIDNYIVGNIYSRELGGKSGIWAHIYNSGSGSASASAMGDTSFNVYNATANDYCLGKANGEVNLAGSNEKFGGEINAEGEISTITYAGSPAFGVSKNVVGRSTQNEILKLNASRGQSFAGESTVSGNIRGEEAGETVVNIVNQGIYNGRYVVDSESTSVGDGIVSAYNQKDKARSFLILHPDAKLIWNGIDGFDATAKTTLDAFAEVERHVLKSDSPRVEAGTTMYTATWNTSAKAGNGNQSFISGEIGTVPDGGPVPLPGFNATAWLINPSIPATNASVYYDQLATTVGKNNLVTNFTLTLNGKPKSGATVRSDAVGAYGAVVNQYMDVDITKATGAHLHASYSAPTINAIEWIEGRDTTVFHDHALLPTAMTNKPFTASNIRGIVLNWNNTVKAT